MSIANVCDYSMSGVRKSSQVSSAAADDVRRQLEKELNDTADRLRQIDLVSPAGAQSCLGRQSGCDVLDEAEANMTRDALFAFRERLLARIKRIRGALARLETGGYGQCVECGAAISVARLCALPEATTCVACQECNEQTAALHPLERPRQPTDRGAAALLAEAIAATPGQSLRAEDAPQVDTRGAPSVDTRRRLATRTRRRPAEGPAPAIVDRIRVAAIQMRAKVGDVSGNLSSAESLVRESFRRGAEWVILPEFFTSAVAFTPSMLSAWLPLEGAALELMRKLAREHDGVIGGSFIAKSGKDCHNSFLLVFPNGQYYRHDKDLPTMWENSYYIGGSDDGVLTTPAGSVGVALCWEFIRTQTVRRLAGRVKLVVGGSCWWDYRLPVQPKYAEEQAQLRNLLRQAPGDLARRLGVPVVHASHAGEFEGLTPGKESVPYASRYLGETQITDGHGNVLARLAYEDGEGVITADITPGRIDGTLAPTPEGFWTTDLPSNTLQAWDNLNPLGREYYEKTFRPLLERSSGQQRAGSQQRSAKDTRCATAT